MSKLFEINYYYNKFNEYDKDKILEIYNKIKDEKNNDKIDYENLNINCNNCENSCLCINCNNCKNCDICKNCDDCKDCVNCNHCDSCDDCVNCKKCENCVNCNHCDSCDDCNECNYCYDCNKCKTCKNCNNCKKCEGCNYCNNCNECKTCKNCESCNDCGNCESCNDCDDCKKCEYCYRSEYRFYNLGEHQMDNYFKYKELFDINDYIVNTEQIIKSKNLNSFFANISELYKGFIKEYDVENDDDIIKHVKDFNNFNKINDINEFNHIIELIIDYSKFLNVYENEYFNNIIYNINYLQLKPYIEILAKYGIIKYC